MKLIIKDNRIAATATDDYDGPDPFIAAAPDFDIERMGDYVIADGQALLPAPTVVSLRQARLALFNAGLLDAIDTAIAGLTGEAAIIAQIEWDTSTEIRREHALVQQIATALELSSEQLDALFVAASAL
jgi:hypothetical protein